MTDQEKIARYEEISALVDDRIALELYFRSEDRGHEAIQSLRAESWAEVVKRLRNTSVLPGSGVPL